jgi:dCMP deaminase
MQGWNHWHRRYMLLAQHVAGWSKDPSTQTGCVIVRADNTVASLGYNGFPRRVEDSAERLADRPTRLAFTVHAEDNAIFSAHESLEGATAYVWPWPPCAPCAAHLVQAGIVHVIAVQPTFEQKKRWGESFKHMETIFSEADIRYDAVPAYWLTDDADEY